MLNRSIHIWNAPTIFQGGRNKLIVHPQAIVQAPDRGQETERKSRWLPHGLPPSHKVYTCRLVPCNCAVTNGDPGRPGPPPPGGAPSIAPFRPPIGDDTCWQWKGTVNMLWVWGCVRVCVCVSVCACVLGVRDRDEGGGQSGKAVELSSL